MEIKKRVGLRDGLGDYLPRRGELPKNALTLHDLGELIRRAGQDADFIVESEFKVSLDRDRLAKKIDWVWLARGQELKPIVAFEIEGRNVDPRSIAADCMKFKKCKALINVFALFQVDHDRTPKPETPNGQLPEDRVKDWVKKYKQGVQVEAYRDEQLMASEGIERLQTSALNKLRKILKK